jgi:hypothetical protein
MVIDTTGSNPGHTHTGASLSSIDISTDTNLAVTAPIVLTDDTLSMTAYLDLLEIAAPATPATNNLRIYNEAIKGFSTLKYYDDGGMKREFMRDSIFVAKNVRGTTIAANRIVYATGSEDQVPTIDLAKADSTATLPAIGVTIESIANGAYGRVLQVGLLENINTNALAEGDILYVSAATAGVPATTPPVTPNLTQEIGTVLVSDVSAGAIQVVARGITGDEFGTVQNTFLIGDGSAGTKTLMFNATADASLTWDEIKLDLGASALETTGTFTGINVTSGADPGHTHTGASLGGIDISADTNLVAGTNITLSDDTLNVDDAFLLNTGDAGSGAYILQASGAAVVPLIVKGAASQSANIMQVQNSAGATLFQALPTGETKITVRDAAGGSAPAVLDLIHATSGTPSTNFGVSAYWQAQSSSLAVRSQFLCQSLWVDATDGTRKAKVLQYVYDTAAREAIRMEASGTAPMLGFYGNAAVARQTISTARDDPEGALADLLTALDALGLITDSSTAS